MFESHDLPEWDTDAQLIQHSVIPSRHDSDGGDVNCGVDDGVGGDGSDACGCVCMWLGVSVRRCEDVSVHKHQQ